MQLMSWTLARLGSRFSLFFEPHRRRVMHSALGRFLDQPLDLKVGLIEPDGTERVMPFTQEGTPFANMEQFERMNSVTFRGYSERYQLRFEFNIHSVFYPQDERLSSIPVFYLEMRLNPSERIRGQKPVGPRPKRLKLFLRLQRPNTQIKASLASAENDPSAKIDLTYDVPLTPSLDGEAMAHSDHLPQVAHVAERIVSLNAGCELTSDGQGLMCELPVTEIGSGTKWRLIWGAYCADNVLSVGPDGSTQLGKLRYVGQFKDIDAVMADAITHRDERLAPSRRFEKLVDQTSLAQSKHHLMCQSFQAFLSNTFWCDLSEGDRPAGQWFSVLEGSRLRHSTLDVEYNAALLYFSIWPRLLAMQLEQWPRFNRSHSPSAGVYLCHDLGQGTRISGQVYRYDMPVEENSNYLLLMQAYSHWTGDLSLAQQHADLIEKLADYLVWTDRDDSGFPSEGMLNTHSDAGPAAHIARKQMYLAVKRLAALQAAADLLGHLNRDKAARKYTDIVDRAVPLVEEAAWRGDHYAVCVDRSTTGLYDPHTGSPLPYDTLLGADDYSIHTANGLLLPAMVGQPLLLDRQRLLDDLNSAMRENVGPYGCGHTTSDSDRVWISQNIWRDLMGLYLGKRLPGYTDRYWDLQVVSNTHDQSLGCVDSYLGSNLTFYPRTVASVGYLMAAGRLIVDKLAPGGHLLCVEPDLSLPQRLPLLPLADWKAGKIPTLVVDIDGNAFIESELDPIIIRGSQTSDMIG